jgi:hypothetical protein
MEFKLQLRQVIDKKLEQFYLNNQISHSFLRREMVSFFVDNHYFLKNLKEIIVMKQSICEDFLKKNYNKENPFSLLEFPLADHTFSKTSAVIAVSSVNKEKDLTYKNLGNIENSLMLFFEDLLENNSSFLYHTNKPLSSFQKKCFTEEQLSYYRVFQTEECEKIENFLLQINKPEISLLIIACPGGQFRSGAIANAIFRYFFLDLIGDADKHLYRYFHEYTYYYLLTYFYKL